MIRKFINLIIVITVFSVTGISAIAADNVNPVEKDSAASGIMNVQKNDDKSQLKTDPNATKVSVSKAVYRFGNKRLSSRDLLFRPQSDKLQVDDLVFRPDKDKLKITKLNISTEKADNVNILKLNGECSTSNILE